MDPYSCLEVFGKLDDFVDRELSPEEMARVREHLERCAQCAAEARFESSFVEGVRAKVRRIAVPQDLLARVLASLATEQEGKPDAE